MHHNMTQKVVALTPPGAIVDNAAFTTASIDTKGWGQLDIFVLFGAMDIAMAALKVQQSDTDGSYVDVAGADFSVSPATLPSATADNLLFAVRINLIGKKRYFDLAGTGGDGAAGTYFTAWAVLSRPKIAPSTAALRGFSQELIV